MINDKLDLNPKDWIKTKEIAHQMIEDTFEFFQSIDVKPCWKPLPISVKNNLNEKLPLDGTPLSTVYSEYKKNIFPYYQGNIHPQYFAWIQGGGNITSALGDFLSSIFNSNSSIGDHAARYVEKQVIGWCKEMFQLPINSEGILLTGSSMANLTAIVTAKNWATKSKMDIGNLSIYSSVETHSCIAKAVKNIGLPQKTLRLIRVNNEFEISAEALIEEIEMDIENGFTPFMIIANIGTANTGAIDSIKRLSKISKKYKLWLHIDGAYGLPAYITKEFANELGNLSKADSIAFDFHKLFNINYDVGCLIVKNKNNLKETFTTNEAAHYLVNGNEGIAGGIETTDNLGFELSRSFKALKIWMTIKEFGMTQISEVIRDKLSQAKYLENYISNEPSLQLMSPVKLSIVNFRFIKKGLTNVQLNELNKKIVITIQLEGFGVPAISEINKLIVIRVCIANHRTEYKHIDALVKKIITIGNKLAN